MISCSLFFFLIQGCGTGDEAEKAAKQLWPILEDRSPLEVRAVLAVLFMAAVVVFSVGSKFDGTHKNIDNILIKLTKRFSPLAFKGSIFAALFLASSFYVIIGPDPKPVLTKVIGVEKTATLTPIPTPDPITPTPPDTHTPIPPHTLTMTPTRTVTPTSTQAPSKTYTSTPTPEQYVLIKTWGPDYEIKDRRGRVRHYTLNTPRSVSVDTGGNLYVSTADGVLIFNSDGNFMKTIFSLDRDPPFDAIPPPRISLNSKGDLFVVFGKEVPDKPDSVSKRWVRKYAKPRGKITKRWAHKTAWKLTEQSAAIKQKQVLNSPEEITFDSEGNIYLANCHASAILKFSKKGERDLEWNLSITGDFDMPQGIAIDNLQNVYVTETRGNRISKFDVERTFTDSWDTIGGRRFNDPKGIAVDKDGNILVADSGNRRIVVFSPSSEVIFEWFSEPVPGGKGPVGVAADSDGNIYIADTEHNRVLKFAPRDHQ